MLIRRMDFDALAYLKILMLDNQIMFIITRKYRFVDYNNHVNMDSYQGCVKAIIIYDFLFKKRIFR